jgi:hypothetical protein
MTVDMGWMAGLLVLATVFLVALVCRLRRRTVALREALDAAAGELTQLRRQLAAPLSVSPNQPGYSFEFETVQRLLRQDRLSDPMAASREYFPFERSLAELSNDRVALVLVRPVPALPETVQFLKRLQITLHSAVRKLDWVIELQKEGLLLLMGQMPVDGVESFLARIAEVVHREEVEWSSNHPFRSRCSMALAVCPTDGTEFDALLVLARRRLDKEICWNIQPPS